MKELIDLDIEELFIDLVDIADINDVGYKNVIDISVEVDETFLINDGIISHNSARSSAISGLSVVGTDYYGVFPLKGKPLNVREQTVSKIAENDEITKIMKALGLTIGKRYKDYSELRYGGVVFMTDADVDGSHIKGLLINMFHKYWPELLELGFIYEFITPLVRARKGKDSKSFYSMNEYAAWRDSKDSAGWTVKYYKGLGTILADEIKDMFKSLDRHLIRMSWDADADSNKTDMLFSKKRADDRKEWLLGYAGDVVPEKAGKPYPVTDFYDKEFIQFSMADNIRSIPDVMDGLKPSQRKILYTCIKKNIHSEVKVQQLAGSVAEASAYHQGENNLVGTITNMAQDFVGSNNINLLQPKGQFGTRLQGGEDAASGRYIFTMLSEVTRLIFRPEDDPILEDQYEEGFAIEPKRYLPVIPMILVNGSNGIGTGWSTDIPKYNPLTLCKLLLHRLDGDDKRYRIKPYYRGFVGEVLLEDDRFVSTAVWEHNAKNRTVKITELPVGVWTDAYCDFLDTLLDKKLIKDYKNSSTDVRVNISVVLNADTKDIQSLLKLSSKISLTNMNAFVDNSIRKFDAVEDIFDFFYSNRLQWYERRKQYQLDQYEKRYKRAMHMHAFISMINQGVIAPMGKSRAELLSIIEAQGLQPVDESYDYLLNMPIHSMTSDRMLELEREKLKIKEEYKQLKNKTIQDMWRSDIEELMAFLENKKQKK